MKQLIPTEQAEKAAQNFVKVSEVNSQRIQDAYLLATEAANTAYITDVVPVMEKAKGLLDDFRTFEEYRMLEYSKHAESVKFVAKFESTLNQLTELLKP